jgi:spore germination protein KA
VGQIVISPNLFSFKKFITAIKIKCRSEVNHNDTGIMTKMELTLEIIQSVTKDFILYLRKELHDVADLHFESTAGGAITVVYISSIVSQREIEGNFLEPLNSTCINSNGQDRNGEWERILTAIPAKGRLKQEDGPAVLADLLRGKTAVHLAGSHTVYTYETRQVMKRPIKEPMFERTLRGPQLSFNESLADNLALIRQGIKSKELVIETLTLGAITQTEVAVCYLGNLASPTLIREVRQRLNSFEIDGVLDSGYLEQLITDNPWSLLPLTQSTERPDKLTAGLLNGKVAIVVDNSPQVILVPTTVNDLYQSPEDYYFGFWSGSFLRFFRIIGNNIAVALPGLYIALLGVNPELLPIRFALSVSGSRMGVAVPLIIELLVMEVLMEVFREASLRLPMPVGQILGITSGIVLATAAVAAGIVSNATTVIVVITAIASFSGPDYSIGLSWRILKFLLVLAAVFLGLFGLTIAGLMILTHAAIQNSFGTPYLAPWSPIDFKGLIDTVIRRPIWWCKRMKLYQPLDLTRFRWKGGRNTKLHSKKDE